MNKAKIKTLSDQEDKITFLEDGTHETTCAETGETEDTIPAQVPSAWLPSTMLSWLKAGVFICTMTEQPSTTPGTVMRLKIK